MRLIDADILEKEGWSLCRTYRKDKETMVYEVKTISEINTAQPTVDAVPVSFIEELKVWAKENGSAEYANDLTHLLSVWAERKEE